MIFEIRRTCFARGSIHPEQRGLSRGCPASRDAISPELIGGQLGMDKAEKAGSWFGFRRGLKGRREGKDFVETKAIRWRENRRMTPGCRRISVQRNRFHAHDAACNKCSWGKEGKNRKKREKEIRERNSQNAPSTRFVPFARSLEIRWFSTRLLESRWYSREGGLEEIRRRIGEQGFFRF